MGYLTITLLLNRIYRGYDLGHPSMTFIVLCVYPLVNKHINISHPEKRENHRQQKLPGLGGIR